MKDQWTENQKTGDWLHSSGAKVIKAGPHGRFYPFFPSGKRATKCPFKKLHLAMDVAAHSDRAKLRQ